MSGWALRPTKRDGATAAEFSETDAVARLHKPSKPLHGFDVFEIPISASSPIVDRPSLRSSGHLDRWL